MKIFIMVMLMMAAAGAQGMWEKLNGPEGGEIDNLQTKGDTIVAGSLKGKIFCSFDNGRTWELVRLSTDYRSIMYVMLSNNMIYLAAQSGGIYRSADFINWTKLNLTGKFLSLGEDLKGNIYAGMAGLNEIYISSDNGDTWTRDYRVPGYGDMSGFITLSDSSILASGQSMVLRKKVNESWEKVYTDSIYFTEYKLFTDEQENIYTYRLSGVNVSTDKGSTWKEQPTGTFFYGNSMYAALYNQRIIGAFWDETGWFGDGWGAAVSDDKGKTWRWSQSGLPPKITGLCLAKSGDDTYMGTHSAGVFKSTDFGESWFSANKGITAANVRDFTFDEEGTLYTASWSNGLAKSTDKGESWEVINNGLSNVYMYSIFSDDDGVLFAGSDQGLFRSTDKGENWVRTSNFGNSYAYHLYKDNQNRVYAFTYGTGIYRTTDLGSSWIRLDKNFVSGYVFGFTMDTEDNIYVGGRGGTIYKSTDDGENWTEVYKSPVSSAVISDISISPNGYMFASSVNEGVIRSTDNGISWEVKHSGIPSTLIRPVAVNSRGEVFTATYDEGIYISRDDGESWIDITDNMKMVQVRRIFIDDDDNLYLATNESVWRGKPDSITSVKRDETLPVEYSLSQNYPNPFNPSTKISYVIPKENYVTLKIYDILGNEVTTLVNKYQTTGRYSINFEGDNLASGIYIYRLQAGDYISSKKMTLIK
jgi:photosystem II stability/assembly factor-like uncharacterized protein